MSTIVTRAGKGSALTFTEADANFTNLNTDKWEDSNIASTTTKTTPVDADLTPIIDSAASNVRKVVSWSNIKATLKTYFDTLYGNVTGQSSSVDSEIALFSSTTGKIIKRATTTGILKGTSGVLSAATAGTDYAKPDTASTWTAKQTFNGSSSVMAMAIESVVEPGTVSATAATGTINFDVSTQSILYYTSSAAANWTVNFRHSSGTSLNTAMNTGDILTVTFAVTQGGTAYYNSAVQVDGNSVTPKYGGGTAWSSGTASGIDIYTYTIIKTGSAAFTVLVDRRTFA